MCSLRIDREVSVATSSGVGLWRQDPFTVRDSPAAAVRAARSQREVVCRLSLRVPKLYRVTRSGISFSRSIDSYSIARANGPRLSSVCDYCDDSEDIMGVIKVTPDSASLISACEMLDDMRVSISGRQWDAAPHEWARLLWNTICSTIRVSKKKLF